MRVGVPSLKVVEALSHILAQCFPPLILLYQSFPVGRCGDIHGYDGGVGFDDSRQFQYLPLQMVPLSISHWMADFDRNAHCRLRLSTSPPPRMGAPRGCREQRRSTHEVAWPLAGVEVARTPQVAFGAVPMARDGARAWRSCACLEHGQLRVIDEQAMRPLPRVAGGAPEAQGADILHVAAVGADGFGRQHRAAATLRADYAQRPATPRERMQVVPARAQRGELVRTPALFIRHPRRPRELVFGRDRPVDAAALRPALERCGLGRADEAIDADELAAELDLCA